MIHRPYSLYKKKCKQGKVWYVRFWSYGEQRYTLVRSTGILVIGKKGREWTADEEARKILETLSYSPTKKTVAQYLTDFWENGSRYIKKCEKLKQAPLSAAHIQNRQRLIKQYINTYPLFIKLPLVELTVGQIEDWMLWLSENDPTEKDPLKNKGISNQQIDKALQTIKVAIHEAVGRQELKNDITKLVEAPIFQYQEKGILRPDEIKKLILMLKDRDSRIAIFLGLCGMRMGEIRGLKYEDITGGQIFIRHNFVDLDGEKAPKCNSKRIIPVPDGIKDCIGKGTGYIFKNRNKKAKGKPVCCGYFRNIFIKSLELIEITKEEQKARFLSFHSLRHTFVTVGQYNGMSQIMTMAQAGHISRQSNIRYTHPGQVISLEEARESRKAAIGL